MLHILKAKEENGAPPIVCDPRFTRTAAHAYEYVRMRPGSDVALIWGILYHIFENGGKKRESTRRRFYGLDDTRDEVKRGAPKEVVPPPGVPKPRCVPWNFPTRCRPPASRSTPTAVT